MEGCVVLYLKVGFAGNLPSQLQGTYVCCCVSTCIRTILELMTCVECTQVMSLFRLMTSFFILSKQLRHHQFLVHSQTLYEFFAVRVMRAQWCTQVFLKFKLSCTI